LVIALAGQVAARTIHRRALLIGINDYSASRLASVGPPVPGRVYSNLDGAVTDVSIMRELLIAKKSFAPSDIVTLTDQQATRAAILKAIETELVAPANQGDIILFYYSGHGSQVRNTLSYEADRLDESLVPADSRRGAPDIRDKELCRYFNRILARGAQLTIVLDSCHSASGARGFDGGTRFRAVKVDDRDVADPGDLPWPEDRGALVFAAAQDFDLAYETMDAGTIHGAFSWALERAMREAPPDEPAAETFASAEARLRVEMPAQEPVIAGNADARLRPFVGTRGSRRSMRPVVAVEKLSGPGEYILNGGWVNGLTNGSQLRLSGNDGVRLDVISLSGMSHAVARVVGTDLRTPIGPGTLLEMATWAAPPGKPLRICIPRGGDDAVPLARALRAEAMRKGIRWLDDPTETTPTHLLRRSRSAWDLVTGGDAIVAGESPLARVPEGAALFVQLPVTERLANALSDLEGIELVAGPETADYVLIGRIRGADLEYAWIRPAASAMDGKHAVLPVRTSWIAASNALAALALRETMSRLERVHGWHELESPPGAVAPFRLAMRSDSDGTLIGNNGRLVGGERYRLALRAHDDAAAEAVAPRYIYVFVIDSAGSGVLLFPPRNAGSVENRLPIAARAGELVAMSPREIQLGRHTITVTEPFGVDTYFLLCTDEPLGSLACLEWDGVRGPQVIPKSELERLLAATAAGSRGDGSIRTPPNWSLDKFVFESAPPGRNAR
jgi:hypothetical protein